MYCPKCHKECKTYEDSCYVNDGKNAFDVWAEFSDCCDALIEPEPYDPDDYFEPDHYEIDYLD